GDGFTDVGTGLEGGFLEGAVLQLLTVAVGLLGDLVDFLNQLVHFLLQSNPVNLAGGVVGGLNCQFTNTLQVSGHGVQSTFRGLRQGDRVSGVTYRDVGTTNLGFETGGNCQTGGVVFCAVDPQAGRQALQCNVVGCLVLVQVALRIQRRNVCINYLGHGASPVVTFFGLMR